MKKTAVVGERGQVTIPKPLRRSLGIKPGSEVCFEERNGLLVCIRLTKGRGDAEDPIDAMIGIGRRGDVDDILGETRGAGFDPKRDGSA